jgi:Flp pilus assembly protein TadG
MRRHLFTQLATSRDAAVAPTVALSLFGLIAVGGIAFDYARMATLDTELQQAADQAALAAATQLDGKSNAQDRARAAAQVLLANSTSFANERTNFPGRTISIPTIVFYSAYTNETTYTAATGDADSHFVKVTTSDRQAFFALTPIVAALSSGNLNGVAVAGLRSGVCKVPPLMICNPNPGSSFDANNKVGFGVQVVAHKSGTWSPGNFGYLDVGEDNNGAPDQLAAMAYQNPILKCSSVGSSDINTGNTEPVIDAANTRFDVYNVPNGSGSTLGACSTGLCPAAANVTKDLVRPSAASGSIGDKSCKSDKTGWQLPDKPFSPRAWKASDDQTWPTPMPTFDSDGVIDAMGLPRDNCHYSTYVHACSGGRIGDGKWAKQDYFNKYHAGNFPANVSTITRYKTYRWEIDQNNMPDNVSAGSSLSQRGKPVCSSGVLDSTRDRRVLSVAIVDNCASLNGSSVKAQIGQWVDMFFVEPAFNRGNGIDDKQIYLEIIGETKTSGNQSVNGQVVRRDVPYLVE